MTGSQREAIDIMLMMESVTVNVDLVAQALSMSPGVLRKHVKDGEYTISKYEICGDRIRFFRKDFLQQIGELPKDPEPKDVETSVYLSVIDGLTALLDSQKETIRLLQEQNRLLHAMIKTPAAATADA